jgi:hypothetical protein
MGKQRVKPNYRRRVLRLPDLDHCKSAVLNNLGSPASRRVYEYAIQMEACESLDWHRVRWNVRCPCSIPRRECASSLLGCYWEKAFGGSYGALGRFRVRLRTLLRVLEVP